jgi:ankyrin repeat protein
MKAAFWGNDEVVKRLLAANADANIKNSDGKTARMIADEIGQTNIAALLRGAENQQL